MTSEILNLFSFINISFRYIFPLKLNFSACIGLFSTYFTFPFNTSRTLCGRNFSCQFNLISCQDNLMRDVFLSFE